MTLTALIIGFAVTALLLALAVPGLRHPPQRRPGRPVARERAAEEELEDAAAVREVRPPSEEDDPA